MIALWVISYDCDKTWCCSDVSRYWSHVLSKKMTLKQFVNNNLIRIKFIPVQQCPSIPCCLRMWPRTIVLTQHDGISHGEHGGATLPRQYAFSFQIKVKTTLWRFFVTTNYNELYSGELWLDENYLTCSKLCALTLMGLILKLTCQPQHPISETRMFYISAQSYRPKCTCNTTMLAFAFTA